MEEFFYLIPISLALGFIGMCAFFWSLRNDQYEDMQGAANRILLDEDKPMRGLDKSQREALDGS